MMNAKQYLRFCSLVGGASLALLLASSPARANVYATNIKFNGSAAGLTNAPGDVVTISYILNENASRGVTLQILSPTGAVRTLTLPGNAGGTFKGVNSTEWDGLDSQGKPVALGTYSVSITAASSGYTGWTQLTDDLSTWNYVFDGRGIAVNQNPNSLYYGRIFVANSSLGPNAGVNPGDRVGILKLNADASPADEGATNDMGYAWQGSQLSPWKVEVGSDDSVYVNDLFTGTNGTLLRWDQTLSPASLQPVLRSDNIPAGAKLSGGFIVGQGANSQIWMADQRDTGSLGILRWLLSTNGACATNDLGTAVFAPGGSLLGAPQDVSVDPRGNVYTCYFASQSLDTAPRVFCFAPYDPGTNGGSPQSTAAWAVGSGLDSFAGASGVAADPTGLYLAVSCWGIDALHNGVWDMGNTRILYATNGSIAASLDLGVPMNGWTTTEHQDTDCAWDAVGNLYYVDAWYGAWRAFSPPGTNQATTVAVPKIQVAASITTPNITGITVTNGSVLVDFTGAATDAPAAFTLQSAASVAGAYTAAPGGSVTNLGPGLFRAAAPAPAPAQFYRIAR